jgi:hypothetical protein
MLHIENLKEVDSLNEKDELLAFIENIQSMIKKEIL